MSEKEINEMFAQFLGWDAFGSIGFYATTFNDAKGSCNFLTSNMKFKTDWNWLMLVVVKISDVLHWSINATLEYLSETQERDGLYTIEDIYNACLEYIKQQK